MRNRTILQSLSILATIATFTESSEAAPPVDFQRQVQPILAEHCTLCHGVDPDDRKAGLRLDVRANALAGGESGIAGDRARKAGRQ